ncbi:MAG: acyl-CoA dehydrogenase family protein [Promethearchaeota archaeon]
MAQSEGNRDNPYSFDDYLLVRDTWDYYADDPFFQALVKHHVGDEFPKIHEELLELSRRASFEFRDLADEAGSLENRLKCTIVKHFDAHNHRVDEIRRCRETEALERAVFDLGLFDPSRNTAWSRFCKMFLLYENSEFGVMCPVACTHGMVWLLQEFEDELGPELRRILEELRDGVEDDAGEKRYAVAAQFLSEIQGGSDVPANLVEAVYEEGEGDDGIAGAWRLYGQKFFCSATQADYALVTAKPKNTPSSTKVALFAVPSWLPGNKERGVRNSYTIDRLKPKLGTAELPTAEITYHGAVAYPVGPLEKGLANVVGVVLTISRLHVAFGMAAGALRVAREATLYAQFREAFGVPVATFPLARLQVDELNHYARRTAAGAFKLYGEFIALGERLVAGVRHLETVEDLKERRRRFRLRELIMWQKIVVANEAPAMTRLAISLFGGHGVMEDFSALPRFLRDSLIMELWEGPRSVLLTQIHRDFQRVREWYPARQFVVDVLQGADPARVEDLAGRFQAIVDRESLLAHEPETLATCADWEKLANELFVAYQELALEELEFEPPSFSFRKELRIRRKRGKRSHRGAANGSTGGESARVRDQLA